MFILLDIYFKGIIRTQWPIFSKFSVRTKHELELLQDLRHKIIEAHITSETLDKNSK